jgi:uncharacterized protein
MKYLLLLPLVLLALWLIQRGRHRVRGEDSPQDPPARDPSAATPQAGPLPTEIIECAHCTLHLPHTDAVAGRHGLHYCCTAHRQDAEGG